MSVGVWVTSCTSCGSILNVHVAATEVDAHLNATRDSSKAPPCRLCELIYRVDQLERRLRHFSTVRTVIHL